MQISSENTKLEIVVGGRLIKGNRIGISSKTISYPTVAVLSIDSSMGGDSGLPIRLHPVEDLPEGILLVGADTASEFDLGFSTGNWHISGFAASPEPLAHVTLELSVEQRLEDAVREATRSNDLYGALLLVDGLRSEEPLELRVGDQVYSVRSWVSGGKSTGIFEINGSTSIELFAPTVKSGVDIVILADCSGSMSLTDLGASEAGVLGLAAGSRQVDRSAVLRESLFRLLDLRLQLAGRVSRIALVAFTDEAYQRFPREGGMIEVDANSEPGVIKGFRDAIGMLHAEQAGTDIGNALQYAADLIYRHGHPANDRLVILVSDGADWAPKGEDATGEETIAFKEPVSLMSHFHRDLKIQLQAIGVSDEHIFEKWWRSNYPGQQAQVSLVPNHRLLRELVQVGGGDPSRTGDAGVLGEYFTGLGQGVTRSIRVPKSADTPSLNSLEEDRVKELAAAARAHIEPTDQCLCVKKGREVCSKYDAVNRQSENQYNEPLFKITNRVSGHLFDLNSDTQKLSTNEREITSFLICVVQIFLEGKNRKLEATPQSVQDAVSKNQKISGIRSLRNHFGHDTNAESKGRRDQRTNQNAAATMLDFIGVTFIARDDAALFARLHLAVLDELLKYLDGISKQMNMSPHAQRTDPVSDLAFRD